MAGRRITIQFLGEDKSLGRTAEGIEKKTSGIGEKLGKVGKVAGAGLAIAGVAAIKFGSDAIKSASDAQQSMGATETVFGKTADAVVKNSERAAKAVGLSANAYRENANLIGSLFKNQGVASDQLAGKTDKMIKLGADLAATFGGTTKDSVEALGSAFKGEYDPLERYGISLKESTVSAELARRGQDKLTGAAANQAKQAVVSDLIMKQSKDSLGAFARESDTLAGAQQRLGAKFEDVKAKLGAKLLPVVTSVVSWFSKFIDQMNSGQGAGGAFSRVMGTIGDIIRPIGSFIGNQMVPFIRELAQKFRDASGGTSGLKKSMGDLAPTVRLLKSVLGVLWDGIKVAYRVLIPMMVRNFQTTIRVIGVLSRVAIGLWNNAFQPTFKFIVGGISNLLSVWSRMLRGLSHIPGFKWARDAADSLDNASRKAGDLARNIRDIPPNKKVKVTTTFVEKHTSSGSTRAPVGGGMTMSGRARGGPVTANTSYLVGERRPEIFKPYQSGRIVPKVGATGGGDVYNVTINGALDPNAVGRQVQQVLLKLKRSNGGAALGIG